MPYCVPKSFKTTIHFSCSYEEVILVQLGRLTGEYPPANRVGYAGVGVTALAQVTCERPSERILVEFHRSEAL
jgi:hypothetical protein